jgi:serine/threonine protein kinase
MQSSSAHIDPTSGIGTAAFAAPELAGGNATYNQSVDIFAWGVMVYAMFAGGVDLNLLLDNGAKPADPEPYVQMIQQGVRYKYLSNIPSAWWTLICQCWDGCAKRRPSADAICARIKSDPRSYLFPGANEQEFRSYIQRIA